MVIRRQVSILLTLIISLSDFPLPGGGKAALDLYPIAAWVINNPEDTITKFFEGTGGITQLYFGNSFEFFKRISLGVNINYLFGSLDKSVTQEFEDDTYYNIFSEESSSRVGGFHYRFGLQYHDKLGENLSFTLGGILENESNLNTRSGIFSTSISNPVITLSSGARAPDVDTIVNVSGQKNEIIMPVFIGGGFTVKYTENLTAGFDYFNQNWSEARFMGERDSITNSYGYAMGMEYVYDPASFRAYWHTIRFRAGGYYNNTYFKINDVQLKEYGMTFGLGFPLRNSNSMFNIGVEMGQRGTTDNNLIKENFTRLNFSFTFYDFWFIKSKFD